MNKIAMPILSLYHNNPNGTGAAIQFELHPAHGLEEGAIYFRIAPQSPNGYELHDGEKFVKTFPSFEWDKSIVGKLGFLEVSEILQVFRGECENINYGKGIYFRSAKDAKTVKLEHIIEPYCGYMFSVTKAVADADGHLGDETKASFTFTPAEALGLCEAFAGSLKEIAFGTGFEATSIAMANEQEKDKETASTK